MSKSYRESDVVEKNRTRIIPNIGEQTKGKIMKREGDSKEKEEA